MAVILKIEMEIDGIKQSTVDLKYPILDLIDTVEPEEGIKLLAILLKSSIDAYEDVFKPDKD